MEMQEIVINWESIKLASLVLIFEFYELLLYEERDGGHT